MDYVLIGYRLVDFTNNEGEKISGYSLFLLSKDPDVIGMKCDKKFVDKLQIEKMGINLNEMVEKTIAVYCDLKGKIVMIQKAA